MTVQKIQSWLFNALNDYLSTGLCSACGQGIEKNLNFCTGCSSKLIRVQNPCQLCGLHNPAVDEVCAACLYDPPRWQQMTAPLHYQGLTRELLMRFKFSRDLPQCRNLIKSVLANFHQSRPEALLPVPLHRSRLLERGFNQAEEIAQLLSTRLNIPLDRHALRRTRHTDAQAGLSAYKRQHNILKAFEFENSKSYRHVAVVDDIITTGATMNEICKILHRNGVETVQVWALARVLK